MSSSQVLVLVQFGEQYQQEFKNDMAVKTTMLKGYHGKCLGISTQVDLLEGSWPANRAMGILEFQSSRDALMWLDSDVTVKQGDWLHGADVIILPTLRCTEAGYNVLQICDTHILDPKSYMEQYVAGHLPELGQRGGKNIVGSPGHVKNRGLWEPQFMVINQWQSVDQFFSWYRSADYQDKWEQYGLESAATDMVLIRMDPLVDVDSRLRHALHTPY